MKKFNLLRTSSLILASYFIVGFSSCSNQNNQDNSSYKKSYYEEIDFNKLIFDSLDISEYLNNSIYLENVIVEFLRIYNNESLYIFTIPQTYDEYKLYIFYGNNYINIGCISKYDNEIDFDYYIYENGYKKIVKHTSIFNFLRELKRYYDEIIYQDLETNYSYKEYSGYTGISKSLIYSDDKRTFEIVLNKNEQYSIKFRYDLINNIEVIVSEEEYDILMNSLLEKYNQKDLEVFIKENVDLLINILNRSKKDSVYYDYNAIFEMVDELCTKARVKTK